MSAVPRTDADAGSTSTGAESWLAHVPIALFAVVMGLGGLGLAWRQASHVLGWPAPVGEGIAAAAAAAFVAIAAIYTAKTARHFPAVRAELRHPVRVNFLPAFSISLLLLAGVALPYARPLAHGLWALGAALQLFFALLIMNRWITRNVEIQHSNPSWFIPVVGNIVVPLAGVRLGHDMLSWFFFSVGLVFWLVLFAIVLNRIIFHDPLPQRILPMLFILMAPPAIGVSAHLELNGGTVDALCHLMFGSALFLALLLLTMARLFAQVPFSIAWWAYTFPAAALAAAAVRYAGLVPEPATTILAGTLLVAATAIIALVLARTLRALIGGRLFVPE